MGDTATITEAGRVFMDPTAYADDTRFHDACALLRRESPVHWVEGEGYHPFWVLTRHADVQAVERDAAHFLNAPRPVLQSAFFDDREAAQGRPLRTLIHMDAPDHRVYRALAADWFGAAGLRRLETPVRELARRHVDRLAAADGVVDFAADVAVHYPLAVLLSLLGLPEADAPRMLSLTQELFGSADEELQRSADPMEQIAVLMDFFAFFTALTESRRAEPTGDLASALANARIDGELLSDVDLASYYVIIATAGHDTTSSTIAGGLAALLEHPDQLARLQADPDLLTTGVEEMLRWVTPVKEFMRTAVVDTEVGGVPIAAGQSLYLAYASANRDEQVFDRAARFDVGRTPNRHLAFGFGPHFCLGAQLARMEVRALFAELVPRIESIEPAGTPVASATTFVGGVKHLPVRVRLRSGANAG